MADTAHEQSEHDKILATIANLNVETLKLQVETSKINTENKWYMLIVGCTATLAIVAFAKLFI